jgi:hypothetical protein
MGEPARDLQVLKDTAGMEQPSPARKTIDLEGRLVKDGVRKTLEDRQTVLGDLVRRYTWYRKLAEKQPLTLLGSEYAYARPRNSTKPSIGLLGCC